jgi:hypothetical protein
MTVTVLRTDGSEEEHTFEVKKGEFVLEKIYHLINDSCNCVNLVNLRHMKKVMLVDDNGLWKELPFNEKATRLYHSVCIPGTVDPIVGNAVLLREEDFT